MKNSFGNPLNSGELNCSTPDIDKHKNKTGENPVFFVTFCQVLRIIYGRVKLGCGNPTLPDTLSLESF